MIEASPASLGTSTSDLAIVTSGLVVRYGRRRAVDGLTLRVPRGSVYGLLGANGAGKTTTIKALLGFRSPSGGTAHVLGYDVSRDRIEINARIGFVSETNSLYAGQTISQLCSFFRSTARRWSQPVVDRYLDLFGLPANARVRQLSKGMKTQLALCLALGSAPDLLILDEPTTGLDPLARRAFLDVLVREVAASDKTVFFSSHILPDIEAVADHVGIVRAGRVVVSDDLDALKQRHTLVRLLYTEAPTDEILAAVRQVPEVAHIEHEGRTVRLRVMGEVAAVLAALRRMDPAPVTVDTSHPTLEDIFLWYMRPGRSDISQESHA